MSLFEVEIPGRPGIKKNSKNIFRNRKSGKPFITTSGKYKSWEMMAAVFIKKAHAQFNFIHFENPVKAHFTVSLSSHKNEPDFGNAVEGVCDLLEKLGVIKNDKLIHEATIKKVFGEKDFISVQILA